MSGLKPYLLLAVIFVVGAVTGSMLTVGFASHFLSHRPPGAQQIKKFWLGNLTRRLDLSADQQTKIEPMLTDAGSQLQSLHREEAARASQIIAETNQKISTVLTAEQQAKLQAMEKEMDQNRDRLFPGGRPHPWEPGQDGPRRGPGGDPPAPQ